jgi:hypothetical protein
VTLICIVLFQAPVAARAVEPPAAGDLGPWPAMRFASPAPASGNDWIALRQPPATSTPPGAPAGSGPSAAAESRPTPPTQTGEPLSRRGRTREEPPPGQLHVSGWVDASYTASTDRVDQLPMGFNYRANEFLMQQNWVRIERAVDRESADPSFGFLSDTCNGPRSTRKTPCGSRPSSARRASRLAIISTT